MLLVDLGGFEPPTFRMRTGRSPTEPQARNSCGAISIAWPALPQQSGQLVLVGPIGRGTVLAQPPGFRWTRRRLEGSPAHARRDLSCPPAGSVVGRRERGGGQWCCRE